MWKQQIEKRHAYCIQYKLIINIICNRCELQCAKVNNNNDAGDTGKPFDVQMKCSILQMICSSVGIYLANRKAKMLRWMEESCCSQFTKHLEEEKKERKKSMHWALNANGIYFWFIRINNYNGRLYWHTNANTNSNTNKSNVKWEMGQMKAHLIAAAAFTNTFHQ